LRSLLLDTQLLVQLVVGLTDESWIKSHKKLDSYDFRDFRALKAFVEQYEPLCVTPNTLTECSNLSRQIGGEAKRKISLTLGTLVRNATELHVRSVEVCEGEYYARLGLADAVLLALMNQNMTLLTDDLDLYATACGIDPERAVNFNHFPHRAGIMQPPVCRASAPPKAWQRRAHGRRNGECAFRLPRARRRDDT
jgi:hypothetical protein